MLIDIFDLNKKSKKSHDFFKKSHDFASPGAQMQLTQAVSATPVVVTVRVKLNYLSKVILRNNAAKCSRLPVAIVC